MGKWIEFVLYFTKIKFPFEKTLKILKSSVSFYNFKSVENQCIFTFRPDKIRFKLLPAVSFGNNRHLYFSEYLFTE